MLSGATGVADAASTHADEATGATVTVVAIVTLGLTHVLESVEAGATGEAGLPSGEPQVAVGIGATELSLLQSAQVAVEIGSTELSLLQSAQVSAPVVSGSVGFDVDDFEASQSSHVWSETGVLEAGETGLLEVVLAESQSAQLKLDVVTSHEPLEVMTGESGATEVLSQSAHVVSELDTELEPVR
jgi:hypothetical protein